MKRLPKRKIKDSIMKDIEFVRIEFGESSVSYRAIEELLRLIRLLEEDKIALYNKLNKQINTYNNLIEKCKK